MKQRYIYELAKTIHLVSNYEVRRIYEGLLLGLSSCSLADIRAIHSSFKEVYGND